MGEETQKSKMKPAGCFLLIIVAVLIVMFAARIWWEQDPMGPMRLAFGIKTKIKDEASAHTPEYHKDSAWLVKPALIHPTASFRVDGAEGRSPEASVDVFYIHPTSGFANDRWNAAYDDAKATARSNSLAIKSHLTAFNQEARLFAPKYRQANFGAFFDTSGQNLQAFMLAYSDVVKAFDYYITNLNEGRPFFIAAHSQGSMHAIPLLMQRLKGTDAGKRMIAAYLVGWPVSVEADIPALGFNACERAEDTNCIISWQTFGMDGNADMLTAYMKSTPGFTGKPRAGTSMLCTNPLTWTVGGTASSNDHKGAIDMYVDTTPIPAVSKDRFGAQCDKNGALFLDRQLKGNVWEQYQMSGLNMHAYDYNLFYMNLIDNIEQRKKAWFLRTQTQSD
ncbi:DUF3089 domain-containing protein [Temperatibacter marinus]|uniref:DUF3089 domain-containing protein n=1 Tax=Temperatibacter marinus TaxID=1456591 RepID=A0AA52EF21_9PROT|nr:DUF3089 domain-containing protein [Temperatibacter marinus]WND02458.1 DUF3089 domain-containing protein [Temperatibacter marinus]